MAVVPDGDGFAAGDDGRVIFLEADTLSGQLMARVLLLGPAREAAGTGRDDVAGDTLGAVLDGDVGATGRSSARFSSKSGLGERRARHGERRRRRLRRGRRAAAGLGRVRRVRARQ